MPRLIKKRSQKAGLPPGTLVHIGDVRVEGAKVTLISYDEAHCQEIEVTAVEECTAFRDKPGVTWINVDGVHQVEVVERIGECFGLHPLVMEDILNTDQRPKMEDLGDYIYIVLKMLDYNEKRDEIVGEQVSLVLGPTFVLSFQEKEGDVFDPIRERIRTGKGRIRAMGADYLAYTLLDSIIDNYFAILERLGERIELLEERVVTRPTPRTLQTIQTLKREMIFLRKSVWPLREVVASLERGDSPLIKESTRVYLRDVYDHTIQVIDAVETFRDMLSGMLDIYLSSVSNRLNRVMEVLTVIATIFMPLTFLVGVYGMNFQYMPELGWRWAYPAVWLVMLAIAATMLILFRRNRWL